MTGHPVNGLDDVVHQRVRLGILTIAHEARRVEFGYLRTNLDLTAGNLSQHLTVLENAGLISIEKGYEGKRARTWVNLTKAGNAALRDEITQLKRVINQIDRNDKRHDRDQTTCGEAASPGGRTTVAPARQDTPKRAPRRGHEPDGQLIAVNHPVFGTPMPVTRS
jgi:DNA-binding MarR family transcriptional regulator